MAATSSQASSGGRLLPLCNVSRVQDSRLEVNRRSSSPLVDHQCERPAAKIHDLISPFSRSHHNSSLRLDRPVGRSPTIIVRHRGSAQTSRRAQKRTSPKKLQQSVSLSFHCLTLALAHEHGSEEIVFGETRLHCPQPIVSTTIYKPLVVLSKKQNQHNYAIVHHASSLLSSSALRSSILTSIA